ncbi:MAG TPA: hypothetical protein P5527_11200 [Kiritimatiellia bacterium]|nr:hypothetical protein [Kiritimatiellia bacterium]
MKRAKTVSKKSSQNIRVTVDISRELLGAVEKAGAFYGFDRAKAIRFFLRKAVALCSTAGKSVI